MSTLPYPHPHSAGQNMEASNSKPELDQPRPTELSHNGSGESVVGLRGLLALGLAGAVLAWLLIEKYYPMFQPSESVREKMVDPRIQLSPEEKQEIVQANYRNSGFAAGVFGLVVSALFGTAGGMARRSILRIVLGMVCGAILGAGLGTVGGLLGHSLYQSALHRGGDIPVATTIAIQSTMLGTVGFGFGLAIAIPAGNARLIVRYVLVATIGGICSGIAYLAIVSLVLPLANTEPDIPRGLADRLLWVSVTVVLISLMIGGLRSRPVQSAR